MKVSIESLKHGEDWQEHLALEIPPTWTREQIFKAFALTVATIGYTNKSRARCLPIGSTDLGFSFSPDSCRAVVETCSAPPRFIEPANPDLDLDQLVRSIFEIIPSYYEVDQAIQIRRAIHQYATKRN